MNLPESQLAHTLGPNRNELRALRQKILTKDVDWLYEKKRAVYTPSGIEKIRAHLRLSDEKSAPAPIVALPEPITLLVWNCRLPHKRIILAYKPGTDPHDVKNLLRVRVRSSENFLRFINGKPMELKARLIEGHTNYYELVGRCPKAKGRW